ncbi:aminopeptidase [Haloarchaeobius sp. HME9146]|uniref:aminopeptidase n=1 Tax=Haloarchaeobius sp. HME9146 TaxID=2978732 RepID=UPI0021BE0324|nr:aminopeptidase [Haloarchaeobius sp. HME9146]MCT9097840.1 aminopeptidase [Haloarchaeobius sp. HME9146]
MDPRIRQHAEIIAEHSTDIAAGDHVIIRSQQAGRDLVVALHEAIGERGARPATTWLDGRAHRAYLRAVDPDALDTPEHVLAFVETADVIIDIKATHNAYRTSDVPPETGTAFGKAHQPVQEAQSETRWVFTQFPTPANAQQAEMSTAAYEDFVWNAINRDWAAQREHQQQLVDILDAGEEVHIQTGDTDIRMRMDDNPVKNDAGEVNLPGGEVYTAPVPDSVAGTVAFDKPVLVRGQAVDGVRLTFENGEVVDFTAERNEDSLDALLDTDEGARRVGELGIGMNRGIDRFTANMLFDEKMGDTIHLALGNAYKDTVSEDGERNESAIHQDMLVDVSEDATIEVDGEVVQRDGTFVFEE